VRKRDPHFPSQIFFYTSKLTGIAAPVIAFVPSVRCWWTTLFVTALTLFSPLTSHPCSPFSGLPPSVVPPVCFGSVQSPTYVSSYPHPLVSPSPSFSCPSPPFNFYPPLFFYSFSPFSFSCHRRHSSRVLKITEGREDHWHFSRSMLLEKEHCWMLACLQPIGCLLVYTC
jgi:hypothetical protein